MFFLRFLSSNFYGKGPHVDPAVWYMGDTYCHPTKEELDRIRSPDNIEQGSYTLDHYPNSEDK